MGDIFGIGASAQAAATAAAAALNYKSQMDYNEKYLQGVRDTNETNVNLAREQNAWNKQQWLDEIAYNDPAKQVQRLRGAGLSAAAAAQSIEGAGNASPLQSADLANQEAPAPLQAPQIEPNAFSFLGLMREFEALRKEKAEANITEKKDSVTMPLLVTDLQLKRTESQMKWQELQEFIETHPYRVRSARHQAKLIKNEAKYYAVLKDVQKWQKSLFEQEFNFKKEFNEKSLNELQSRIELIGVQKENEVKKGEQIEATTANINADTRNKKSQYKLIEGQVEQQELQNILTEFGYPETTSQKIAAFVTAHKVSKQSLNNMLRNLYEFQKSGYEILGDDPLTDDFLKYIVNEGWGTDLKQGIGSKNTLLEIMQGVTGNSPYARKRWGDK